jgi:hypothetical protein
MIAPFITKIDRMEKEIDQLLKSEASPKRYILRDEFDIGTLEVPILKETFEDKGWKVDYSYDGDNDFLEFTK